MKIETFYAAFSFDLPSLANGLPVHEGREGLVLAIRDKGTAYQLWEKLQNVHTPAISAFGCGPDGGQHVHLPVCTGLIEFNVPKGLIENDIQVVVMNPALHNEYAINIQPEWIMRTDFKISGDISHGPLHSTQLTNGDAPDYTDLSKFAMLRLNDLQAISTKMASDSFEVRARTDLTDEHTRESLCDMYNSTGFAHKRFRINDNMTPEMKALMQGLEYLQPYLHSMNANLGIDSIIRHVYSMETEFRTAFPEAYAQVGNANIAAAQVVAQMMEQHAKVSAHMDETITFLSLKANAEKDMEMFHETEQTPDEPLVEHNECEER